MSRNPNDNHLPITQIFLCNGNVARFNCVVTPDNLPGGRRLRLDKRPNFAEFSACRMRVILKQKGKVYFPRSCQLSNLSYRCHGGFHRLHILMKESLCNSVSHVTQLCDRFLSTNWHMGNRMTAISLELPFKLAPTTSDFTTAHAALSSLIQRWHQVFGMCILLRGIAVVRHPPSLWAPHQSDSGATTLHSQNTTTFRGFSPFLRMRCSMCPVISPPASSFCSTASRLPSLR